MHFTTNFLSVTLIVSICKMTPALKKPCGGEDSEPFAGHAGQAAPLGHAGLHRGLDRTHGDHFKVAWIVPMARMRVPVSLVIQIMIRVPSKFPIWGTVI